jgi:hypothetical protein
MCRFERCRYFRWFEVTRIERTMDLAILELRRQYAEMGSPNGPLCSGDHVPRRSCGDGARVGEG